MLLDIPTFTGKHRDRSKYTQEGINIIKMEDWKTIQDWPYTIPNNPIEQGKLKHRIIDLALNELTVMANNQSRKNCTRCVSNLKIDNDS